MQQTVTNFQVYFAKSKNGHYFCPFFSFPKKSWKKINTKLYNKFPNLLKENNDLIVLKNKYINIL
jgi:hypothetical protein